MTATTPEPIRLSPLSVNIRQRYIVFKKVQKSLTVNSKQLSVKQEGETPHQLVKGFGGWFKSPTIYR